jgi:hypothetical protein
MLSPDRGLERDKLFTGQNQSHSGEQYMNQSSISDALFNAALAFATAAFDATGTATWRCHVCHQLGKQNAVHFL